MNIEQHLTRLADLEKRINKLDSELITSDRDALDLSGTEEECEIKRERAAQVRCELERLLRAHFIESTFVLSGKRAA